MDTQGVEEVRRARLRWPVILAWVVALGLHVAALLWLARDAASGWNDAGNAATAADRLILRLLPSRHVEGAPVKPPASAGPRAVARPSPPAARAQASRRSAMGEPAVTGAPAGQSPRSPLQLYNVDGSISLGAPAAGAAVRDGNEADMRHFQQLPCHGTRFAHAYVRGQDETVGDGIARKYLRWIGLYNAHTEAAYQQRRAWHDRACAP